MSWTTPRTWVTSQLVTANDLNTDLRDNLNYLYSRSNIDEDSNVGVLATSATTASQVGTVSVTLTTIGNPVLLMAEIGRLRVSNASYILYLQWYNATQAANRGPLYQMRLTNGVPAHLSTLETPSVGTTTWYLRWYVDNAAAIGYVEDITLRAIELL